MERVRLVVVTFDKVDQHTSTGANEEGPEANGTQISGEAQE